MLNREISLATRFLSGAQRPAPSGDSQTPAATQRPSEPSFRTENLAIPAPLAERIALFSAREKESNFVVLAASFIALLNRYTGLREFALTARAGDGARPESVGREGRWVSLRAELTAGITFRELARALGKAASAAGQDADPLALEVTTRASICQLLFALRSSDRLDEPFTQPDLAVWLLDLAGGFEGSLRYNANLVDNATISRTAGHWRKLLEGVIDDPDRRVSEAPLLTEAEHRILADWNNTAASYPSNATIQDLFEAQVARTPEAVAVVSGDETLSYAELNRRANQLAVYLRGAGVGHETLVGVCVERSPEMVVTLLGILKAGGAYVPLDPAYPAERLAYMLQDAQVPIVVTQRRVASALPHFGGALLILEDCIDAVRQHGAGNISATANAENLAYVIYTSGSTGKPKGVQICHRAVVNLLTSMKACPGLVASDKLLAVTTLSFDIAGLELFLPLVTGAQVILAGREAAWDGSELAALLDRSQATVLQATPATWRMLVEAGWRGNPALRMLCGGEALSEELAARLLEYGGELWNMYGPTETTIWSSIFRIEKREEILIGRPIANTQFHVLGPELQPAPIGVAGELYIGGDGLARGYLNQPELTAAKFLSGSLHSGSRLYRTGDLARLRTDGNFEFLGRIDQQIKIRGFRIEIGEIESVLRQHPDVRQAVVAVREDASGNKRLVAYVELRGSAAAGKTQTQLRTLARGKLPEYMRPWAICVVQHIPLTANGKVDKSSLPQPASTDIRPEGGFDPPRDELEQTLCAIWEEVLDTRPIGIRDNFFDLGGHSLLAARLFAKIKLVCGKSIPMATLFQASTVASLAAILRQDGWRPSSSSLVAIRPEGDRPILYLISGIGGNVVRFRDLARHLGPDQPVYALQPPGLDESEPYLTRMEDMAAHYIGEIKARQPCGPYYLAGYSFGGVVVFEMARQLVAGGDQVGLTALLDAPEWGYFCQISKGRTISEKATRLRNIVMSILSESGRWRHLSEGLARRSVRLVLETFSLFGQPLPQRIATLEDINSFAAGRYVPKPYSGKLILLRTSPDPKQADDDYQLGWGALAEGGTEVLEISGQHLEITDEPNVQTLAQKLRPYLDPSAVPQPEV